MAREQVAPTKSNLIRVKERLNTALEGYDFGAEAGDPRDGADAEG